VPVELLAPARPTFQVGGRDVPALEGALVDCHVHETADGLFSCEATFANWGAASDRDVGFVLFGRDTLDFGKDLLVAFAGDAVFRGRITGLEAGLPEGSPPQLTVLAEDRLQDLRMTRRTRSFADVSDEDVFRQIAGDHGLTPDLSVTGPTHRALTQLNLSDLAFMRERARAVGAELWVDDRTLHARARADRGETTVTLAYGSDLRELTVLADLAGQRTTVTVTGWDVGGKAGVAESADAGALGSELGGDESGAGILGEKLAARTETVATPVSPATDEARARAEALFRRRARRFVRGRGVAAGSARLRVGVKVTLEGLGPLFSGGYYLAECRHVFDDVHGYRTEIVVERPGIGRPT
jgi:uncharacterized protein